MSLIHQTVKPSKIIILDDCSDGEYAEVVERHGKTLNPVDVEIVRFDGRRGKAANINYALQHAKIDTPYLMVLDADTRIEPRYVEKLFEEAPFDVAYGTVLPDFNFPSLYAYHRLVEYIYGHEATKQGCALIKALNITGCSPIFKTETLRAAGGYPPRTFTEDLDLAWIMHEKKKRIIYAENAMAYTREPSSFKEFNRQIHRWLSGFWQALKVHGGKVGESNWLTLMLSIILFDLIIFTPFWLAFLSGSLMLFLSRFQLFYNLVQPLTANVLVQALVSTWQRWFPFATSEFCAALGIAWDMSIIATITFHKARKLKCLKRAALGFPIFYLLSWYVKLVWLKCMVKAFFYKPPKETPTW